MKRRIGMSFTAAAFLFLAVARGEDLQGVAAIITARAAYLQALAQAKLADAQAQLAQSQAAYTDAKTAQLQQLIVVLQHEYERVLREEADTDRAIAEVRMYSAQAAPIKTGHCDAAVIGALYYFIRGTLPIPDLKDTLFRNQPALGVENFAINDEEDGLPHELVPFKGGNVGQLLQFLSDHDFSLVPWTAGHAAVLDLIGSVIKAADAQIEQYHKYMDGIRAGTLPIWNLPTT